MPDAVLLAPLMVALALGLGGASKIGSGRDLARAFDDLDVPPALAGPAVVAVVPWLELALAAALVVVPAPAAVVVTAAAALLLAGYLLLVVRAVHSGRSVSCDCFGGFSEARVGAVTVARNLLLLAAAVLAVVDALAGHSLGQRLVGLDRDGMAWLVGAAALGLLVALVFWRPAEEEVDLDRRGIPFLRVLRDDGSAVTLPELASTRAQLLVTLSESCSRCVAVTEVIGSWAGQVPEIDVRVVTRALPGEVLPPEWPGVLHDPDDTIATVLGMARPSAVLLGADALVAGGPVHGRSSVLAFFDEIREELEAVRQDEPR